MNKSVTVVISVLVVIVVVFGALYGLGLIHMNTPAASTNSTGAKNVVGANIVSSSLGNTWKQDYGATGTVSNLSTFMSITSGRSIGGIPAVQYSPTVQYNSVVSAASSTPPSNSVAFSISSFQFAVFSPNGSGFATIGYAEYKSTTNASEVFGYIFDHANNTTSAGSSHITTGKTSTGYKYIYAWNATSSSTLKPHNQNMSILLGNYNAYLIVIFYLTPTNGTLSKFVNLYSAEINALSSASPSTTVSTFVSDAKLGTDIGNNWATSLSVSINVTNATSIIREFSGNLNGTSATQRMLLNQTLGNLTEFGMQSYGAGTTNLSVISYAKFKSSTAPTLIFGGIAASLNNTSIKPVAYNGSNYLYVNYNYSGSGNSTFVMHSYNVSILIADYNDYAVFMYYVGSKAVTQTQFQLLLGDELKLL